MKLILWLIVAILMSTGKASGESFNLHSSPGHKAESVNVDRFVEYLRMPKDAQVDDIVSFVNRQKFEKTTKGLVSFSFSDDQFWLKFTVKNDSGEPSQKILDFANAGINDLQVFIFEGDQLLRQYNSGNHFGFTTRPLDTRTFAIPLDFAPHQEFKVIARVLSTNSIYVPLNLWDKDAFWISTRKSNLYMGFFFGAAAIMVIYNLFVFAVTRNMAYASYSLFVFAHAYFQLSLFGYGFQYFWRDYPIMNHYHGFSGAFAVTTTLIFTMHFLELKNTSRKLYSAYRIAIFILLLECAFAFIKPGMLPTKIFAILTLFISTSIIATGVKFSLKGSRSAIIFTLAWIFFMSGTFAVAMTRLSFLGRSTLTDYSQVIGNIIELVLLSIALADRLNELKSQLQTANASLKDHIDNVEQIVQTKTKKIRSILKNISQGIMTIDNKLKIESELSDNLMKIMEKEDLAEGSFVSNFIDRCDLNNDDKSKMLNILQSSLDEDLLQFEANQDGLPIEVTFRSFDDSQKLLSLSWDPILDDDNCVISILVSIRDITKIRELEQINAKREDELEKIGNIIKIPDVTFAKFLYATYELIERNRDIVESITTLSAENLNTLFLNMHTLKGSSRAYGFKELSSKCHDLEQSYAQSREKLAQWDRESSLKDLDDMFAIVKDLETIAIEKLGRSVKGNTIPVEAKSLEMILLSCHQSKVDTNLSRDAEKLIKEIEPIISDVFYLPARSVFDRIFAGADKLARDLKKEHPKITLLSADFLISSVYEKLFERVFVHLLRNSMFHGIEAPQERTAKGKNSVGEITLGCSLVNGVLVMQFFDDGGGLNLNKIREKAIAQGADPSTLTDTESVAELIFTSGLSTSDKLTDIAGRGVGMDAVRSYLTEAGGQLTIQVCEALDEDHHAFRLVIQLPRPHFKFEPEFKLSQSA